MTYVLPQVEVFQDFDTLPTAALHPLHAHISGGHAHLQRFSETDERAAGLLGYYSRVGDDTCYSWPGRPAGGVIDESYTQIHITNALLKYFEDLISSGTTTINRVSGYNNRIRASNISFKANGDAYPRDDVFNDRDVTVGDVVKVRAVVDGTPYTLWTYVRDFAGEILDDIINDAESDDGNQATTLATVSIDKTDGPGNCIVATPSGAAYDGLASGKIQETYVVRVIESSGGNDLTTAKLSVTSASGTDDDTDVTPSPVGEATAIGTRGLTVTFSVAGTDACSLSAGDDDASAQDLVAEQEWTIVVTQAFTEPTATSGGDYTGEVETTYVVEVTKGGVYADVPQVSVTTTTGVDISGPHNVTGAAVDVSIGQYGVTAQFDSTALRKGDKYYITVHPETEGLMQTLILGHNLHEDIPAGTDCDLTLFIRVPELEITENRTGSAPLVNWEQSATEICVKGDISVFNSTWTLNGVQLPLDVYSESSQGYGKVYATYRAWLSTLTNEVGSIEDVSQIDDLITGALHPDNPLKWAVSKALANSNGTAVKYTAVADPEDSEGWVAMLDVLRGRDDVYGLVPLTHDATFLGLVASHVDAMSVPTRNQWRVMWTALEGIPTKAIVTSAESSDGEVVLGVMEDDPNTSGTQYTIVRVPAGNGNFLTNEVEAGDILRFHYTGDGFGNYTYSEYTIDAVLSEDEVRLLEGDETETSVAKKLEIHRNLSANEESAAIAVKAGAWANRRIRAVWPDTIETDGTEQDSIMLCAALSGLASGIVPHQGMTRLEIAGFDNVDRTTVKFNLDQLNTMAEAGAWIVSQDRDTGKVFTRHAVTTGDNAILTDREEMIVRNVDSISFRFHETFEPMIGVTNVTPSLLSLLRVEILSLVEVLKGELFTPQLGGQLVDATITDLRVSPIFKDRVILRLACDGPEPFNNLEVHLVF